MNDPSKKSDGIRSDDALLLQLLAPSADGVILLFHNFQFRLHFFVLF